MKLQKFLFAVLLFVVLAAIVLLVQRLPATSAPQAAESSDLRLQLPPIVAVAEAGTSQQRAGVSFLQEEAGMSAYTNLGKSINLATLRPKFRTIEAESDEYIIGSVPVPDHDETWDVHVYAHRDGWLVAYYLSDEPVAKIIDWQGYDGGSTVNNQLAKMLGVMASVAGAKLGDVGYYDFRYPEASAMMFLAEYGDVGDQSDSFDFQIPGEYIIHERSYLLSAFDSYWGGSECKLNETTLQSLSGCGGCWKTEIGTIGAEQMALDEMHTLSVLNKGSHAFCALVLVYSGE